VPDTLVTDVVSVSLAVPEPLVIMSTPLKFSVLGGLGAVTEPVSVPEMVQLEAAFGPVSVLSTLGSSVRVWMCVAVIWPKSATVLVPTSWYGGVPDGPLHVHVLSPVSDGIESVFV
jgi:hypothetical protein